MREHAVAENNHKHGHPIVSRQRHETEYGPQRGIGQERTGAGHEDRRQDQCVARATLEKWDPCGADDVDDEGLRQQRFDKPPVWNSGALFQAANSNSNVA